MTPPHPAFMLMDALRRGTGIMADVLGFGPVETPWRTVADLPGARLRAYHPPDAGGRPLLIVPAPFKRSYIWDLLPEVSVVRACLRHEARVFLLEWLLPGEAENGFGLAEYTLKLPEEALGAIAAETGETAADLAGHSLGGTFAAILAALRPRLVRRLVLVDAPLAFGRHGGPLARAVAGAPHAGHVRRILGDPVPGSAINLLSGSSVPEAFVWQRWADLLAAATSAELLRIHACVTRWTLDEFPLPGRLFEEVAERLYREDRLVRGTLQVGSETAAIERLRAPTIGVVNPAGKVVPPESLTEGLRLARLPECRLLRYDAGPGPMLQHVGPLVAPSAHRTLWPRILAWLGRAPQPSASGEGRRRRAR